jgi:hypothetical protein
MSRKNPKPYGGLWRSSRCLSGADIGVSCRFVTKRQLTPISADTNIRPTTDSVPS